jgi:hypothetical protein
MHAFGLQILLWQTASACDALQLPMSSESIDNGLLMVYGPPMALSRTLFGYQQYSPASLVVAIALSITIYSVILALVLLTVISRCSAGIVAAPPSKRNDTEE